MPIIIIFFYLFFIFFSRSEIQLNLYLAPSFWRTMSFSPPSEKDLREIGFFFFFFFFVVVVVVVIYFSYHRHRWIRYDLLNFE